MEYNPWLRRVGWADHFKGMQYGIVRWLASPEADEYWPEEMGIGLRRWPSRVKLSLPTSHG